MTIEVTEYDRPSTFGSRTTMSWADVRGVLTFEAAGSGTRMRWTWDVQPKGLARVLMPVVGLMGRRQERAVWEGLRRYLENRSLRGSARPDDLRCHPAECRPARSARSWAGSAD